MITLFGLAALLGLHAPSTPVHIAVDAIDRGTPISPYIYGDNQPDWNGASHGLTLTRLGGNRWTAYNWETNASNAGNDYLNQNDSFLGGGETAGEAVRPSIAAALKAGAAVVVTVPMAGYVSADKLGGGDVNKTPDYLHTRFYKSLPRKNAPFVYPPDTTDNVVYQDEFVAWLEKTFAAPGEHARLFYSLDNEPDLWDNTHARLRTGKLTYAELLERSIDYAQAIKKAAPACLIFGPASYGWNGYVTLQNAPDAAGRNFLDFYLAGMRQAEKTTGIRLLDVLDLHWYPEARGGGKRITEGGDAKALVQARLQAPRSLWDPTYREDSWIARDALREPIRLLPRIKEQIARGYPGTKLAITEYNYGGGGDISGALAEADVLGVFGREGVFAAAFWHLAKDERFIYGAFAMYRNFDGKEGHFGDLALPVQNSDVEQTAVYAGRDSAHPDRLMILAINKTDVPLDTDIAIKAKGAYRSAALYRLTAASDRPHADGEATVASGNHLAAALPPMSITLFALQR